MTIKLSTRVLEIISILKDHFGDNLHKIDLMHAEQIQISVLQNAFTDGAQFIYENPLFDTRYLTFTAVDRRETFDLYLIMLLKHQRVLLSLNTSLSKMHPIFKALTPVIPPAEWHEREIHDLFGIIPEGIDLSPLLLHRDWPQEQFFPLRKDFEDFPPVGLVPHQFDLPSESGYHQVAVGPIHAGIIEPGHLRFTVTGEKIHQFNVQLFYTHKGIEKMAEGKSYRESLNLAEHVCGLCAFSHSLAFTQALEMLGQITVPQRVISIRAIFLEMERLASHFADLSAICSAGGFSLGSVHSAYFREVILQLNKEITGHRFLRGFNDVGGLCQNIPTETFFYLQQQLESLLPRFKDWSDLVMNHLGFLDRIEETGILSHEQAKRLGLVGPSARGSGVDDDLRKDFPCGVHTQIPISVIVREEGDVKARMNIRIEEIRESINNIQKIILTLEDSLVKVQQEFNFPPYTPAVGLVESPKGGILHWLMMDEHTCIYRWHIRSASYMNWRGMVQATMGNNIIPDAPLVNKSFNLCYACVDR